MTSELSLFSALLIGLLGSVHCAGMCGGIVGALTLSARDAAGAPRPQFLFLVLYNVGRILSYVFAGALAGGLGAQALDLLEPAQARTIAAAVSGAFMVLFGFYLTGWWPVLVRLEQWGGVVWRRVAPLGRRLMPVRTPVHALAAGLVWGWLPCGMVYSVLAWALMSGSAAQGGMLMAAFGIGTLPMLLLLGAAAGHLQALVRNSRVRVLAGLLVIAFGVAVTATPFVPGGSALFGHAH